MKFFEADKIRKFFVSETGQTRFLRNDGLVLLGEGEKVQALSERRKQKAWLESWTKFQ